MKLNEFGGDLTWDDGKDATIADLRAQLATSEQKRIALSGLEVEVAKLRDALAKAEAERDELRRMLDPLRHAADERDAARARCAALETLRNYADHTRMCARSYANGECNCGYDEARAALSRSGQTQEAKTFAGFDCGFILDDGRWCGHSMPCPDHTRDSEAKEET